MGTGKQYDEEFKKQAIMLAKEIGNAAAAKRKARYSLLDFLGNFRSTVLLVSSAPGFVSLPCITPSSAAVETLRPAQNILRNTALLQFPRKYSI